VTKRSSCEQGDEPFGYKKKKGQGMSSAAVDYLPIGVTPSSIGILILLKKIQIHIYFNLIFTLII
jgi:hypothetical protein